MEPGVSSSFLQHVVSIDEEKKQCYQLGELSKKIICIPNLDNLFEQNK